MRSHVRIILLFVIILSFIIPSFAQTVTPKKKTLLFNNKDFTGWKRFLKSPDVDVNTVWSVKDGIVACTGKPTGYMRTETDYADYKLHVEWRWVVTDRDKEALAAKKKLKGRNNGVLVHMSEPDKVWPKSIECQLMMKNAGDFFVIGGTEFNEHYENVKKWEEDNKNKLKEPEVQNDKGKKKKKKKKKAKGPSRRVPKKEESSEKPLGEWNEYSIICKGDSINVYVNGTLQNTARGDSVKKGMICLQSEGSPIEFRNVYIEPIK